MQVVLENVADRLEVIQTFRGNTVFMTGIDSTALKATFLSFKVFLSYGQYSEDSKILSWEISVLKFLLPFLLNYNMQETWSWFFSLSSFVLKELEGDSSLSLPQCSDKVPASLLLPTAAWNQIEST